MAPRYALELVNRTLCDICNDNRPFGGKIIVLGGDFRQLLPIKLNATRTETINLSIKFSKLWKHFKISSLTQNMRTLPEEVEFAEFVLSIGNGSINNEDDYVTLPQKCVASKDADIVADVYADAISNRQYDNFTMLAILSPRNIDVDLINDRVVNLLDAESEKIYNSVDSTENCDNGVINESILVEYLNSINPPNFPPHNLKLRLYSVIMLVRNLSINEGLCNGTRLMVIELGTTLLKCKILTGDKVGDIVFINRITLYYDHAGAFTFKRRQFPVKLAFAMTINKAQGQTFNKIGIDLQKDVFNHGQLYVAMSRVKSWDSLKIYLNNDRSNDLKHMQLKENISNLEYSVRADGISEASTVIIGDGESLYRENNESSGVSENDWSCSSSVNLIGTKKSIQSLGSNITEKHKSALLEPSKTNLDMVVSLKIKDFYVS
ncbi:ATP-dependent DNA helicase PIF1-like [Cotesia glomerata]|uniref:ATP-dependent DNA helicase PIF1-like n=1 Tax=Cotesia glomerata TaxID=32391 RepID=UPI001D0354C7|nr:ATP-dependent DNA helicase PIF1-like [Cotesia glomerata]